MDLALAQQLCEIAIRALACSEGDLEVRCRRALENGILPAVPVLPTNYLQEIQVIEQAFTKGRPLSTEEAHTVAQGILYVCSGVAFRYAQATAVERMHEGDGPRPLPRPPSRN
jgi:hypothetical protein